jgi:GxxExxY protein
MLEASAAVEELATRVIGAAIEVHRHLGPGLLESAYESAMAIELDLRGIAVQTQHELVVHYKGHVISTSRADLLVGGALVVELKAVETISAAHVAQTLGYLVAGGYELGLIVNFNHATIRQGLRRVIRSADRLEDFAPSRLRGQSP